MILECLSMDSLDLMSCKEDWVRLLLLLFLLLYYEKKGLEKLSPANLIE